MTPPVLTETMTPAIEPAVYVDPLEPRRRQWPATTTFRFDLRRGHSITACRRDADLATLRTFHAPGPIQLAMHALSNLVCGFAFTLPGDPEWWLTAPYVAHEDRTYQEPLPVTHPQLMPPGRITLRLVQCDGGVLLAERHHLLTPAFHFALNAKIAHMKSYFAQAHYVQPQRDIYHTRFRNDGANLAAIATTKTVAEQIVD